MGPPFVYDYYEKPPHLVTFYDTLEIRRTYSHLKPPPKFQLNLLKHVGENCDRRTETHTETQTDGQTDGRMDEHHHTIYVPSEDGRIKYNANIIPFNYKKLAQFPYRNKTILQF